MQYSVTYYQVTCRQGTKTIIKLQSKLVFIIEVTLLCVVAVLALLQLLLILCDYVYIVYGIWQPYTDDESDPYLTDICIWCSFHW